MSSASRSHHMANPNPQAYGNKFRGIRDSGYSRLKDIDPTDIIKFGKKVNYEKKLTHDEVMQEHLKQIRHKMEVSRQSMEIQRKQEKEFLDNVR